LFHSEQNKAVESFDEALESSLAKKQGRKISRRTGSKNVEKRKIDGPSST
jgi:hypothetical protein